MKRIVITGTPGAGKTTLINALTAAGYRAFDEPARRVLAEQRAIDGPDLPEKSPARFVAAMAEYAVQDYAAARNHEGPVFYDRGVADMIAYAMVFNVDPAPYQKLGREHPYDQAFLLRPWENIFCNDAERTLTFEASMFFHEKNLSAYEGLGYQATAVPEDSIETRRDFVISHIRR